MSDQSNNPPYVTLELNEHEARWLIRQLACLHVEAKAELKDVAGMSSTDPRAVMRSSLVMVCAGEMSVNENINELMANQQSSLVDEYSETVVKAERLLGD